jgi:hypothetical protein
MSTKQGKEAYGTALWERRTRYDLDDALVLEGGAHRISKAAQHKVKMTFYFGSWEGWFMKDTVTDLRYLARFSSKTRLYKGSDVSNTNTPCGKMLRAGNIKHSTAPPQVFLVIPAASINDK